MKYTIKFQVFGKHLMKTVEAESFHGAQAKFLEEFKERFSIDLVEPQFTTTDDAQFEREVDHAFSEIFGVKWNAKNIFK